MCVQPLFCNLPPSLRLSLARCPDLSGSLWLSQALSGSLRLSLALYCSPNLLTKPLLGSQGPCSAHKVLVRLVASLLRYSTLSSPVVLILPILLVMTPFTT